MFKSKIIKDGWRHAFALDSANQPLGDFEKDLIDRLGKFIVDRGLGGPVIAPSSYFMKSPPVQYTDDEARELLEDFIAGEETAQG